MIWQSLICSSLLAASLHAASVTGWVELLDSHEAAVRKKKDYSGVVISLEPVGGKPPRVEPMRATMLQKDKTFSPHVLAITTGSSVSFPNVDPIFHNAFSNYNGQIFDVGLYQPGTTRTVKFNSKGVVLVFCNIHSMMSAVIVVLDTPYFAATSRDGSFAIPSVPPGEYDLSVFHERATEPVLRALKRRIHVPADPETLPQIQISEAGYLAIPHSNKFGHEYSAEPHDPVNYPSRK
jgi:plastocyanin